MHEYSTLSLLVPNDLERDRLQGGQWLAAHAIPGVSLSVEYKTEIVKH